MPVVLQHRQTVGVDQAARRVAGNQVDLVLRERSIDEREVHRARPAHEMESVLLRQSRVAVGPLEKLVAESRLPPIGEARGVVNRPQTAPSYMASKGAVHMLTKALAAEWAKSGVRVNALAPGYIATDMTLKMRERPELFNVWLEMTPMGRLGETSEVAAAVLYLASPASGYVTGAILSIDGGYTAW